jgi:hypothetical protein
MELMDTARIQLKHTGSKCLADFKAQSEYALPLGRKTIQQKCLTTTLFCHAEVYSYNISAGKVLF